ncbi:tryptophan dimethylallyltransferase 1 [Fusarium subglutinans]|uniref:Tryptophan dimethylallyltransferase 1 n=1 Tax=Gibberella subglutinans TaxID=42677 RepID=A0A8H5V629_GIBSU|nr:tryptophan dimethylallyltransferase 1 [Fusarium subglutinans]KAF5609634.1 tryptophan dimethylallyltransferase 1 [Fusarium subglutinans]
MPGKVNLSELDSGTLHSLHHTKNKTGTAVDIHQQHWNQTVGSTLRRFLASAGYDSQSQSRILDQFSNLVAPFLGSSPVRGEPIWKSFMTDNNCPVELSWDFHTGNSQPTIRYSIEPIGLEAGTATDLHNEEAAAKFVRKATRAFPDIDIALFNHFYEYFNGRWNADRPEGHRSTMFWAFDLKESVTTNKAYFFPGLIAHAMDKSTLEVMADSITSAPGCRPQNISSFASFSKFIHERQHLGFEMDMLALDLVPVEESRLKIYFRIRRTDFRSVTEMMSLGGRIHGQEFDVGMRNLRNLWDMLLGTSGVPDDIPLPHNNHRTSGILYNVEFRTNSTTPKVKIYIPVRHYAKNDSQIIEALGDFLTDQTSKLPDLAIDSAWAKRYANCLDSIFGEEKLSNGLGVHTYIGCSIQTKGDLRIVAYVNPQQ